MSVDANQTHVDSNPSVGAAPKSGLGNESEQREQKDLVINSNQHISELNVSSLPDVLPNSSKNIQKIAHGY